MNTVITTAELKTKYLELIEEMENLVRDGEILEGDRLNIKAKLEVLKGLLDWY